MKYIELFAGCGGLSLGLESLGFDLVFANELSPMAGETYAYNLLGEELIEIPSGKCAFNVKWISSNFRPDQIDKRLRENPQTFPKYSKENTDLNPNLEQLNRKLLIGSIIELNKFLSENSNLVDDIQKQNIDLVSGGPPCQSFSMAGLRQHNNHRNTLPMDFADLVSYVKPKITMLENVSGILRAFSLPDGKHYAWFEVARAFASKGYFPLCLHVNAKYAGAAQNRPRFIMIAIREDIFKNILSNSSPELSEILSLVEKFYHNEKAGIPTKPFEDLNYIDIEKNPKFFEHKTFSSLFAYKNSDDFFTVKDAIDDLRENNQNPVKSRYLDLLDKVFCQRIFNCVPHENSNNGTPPFNNIKVRMRFKLYQHMATLRLSEKGNEKDIQKFLKDPENHILSESSIEFLLKQKYLHTDGTSLISFDNLQSLKEYLSNLATKKQTQRALIEDKPAPAALSIPDDACHYHNALQRTLTVREMARFQSFPDWFELKSKVTTGGQMRKFEVPQYTQVGNAVPPLLGRALGQVVINLLDMSHE